MKIKHPFFIGLLLIVVPILVGQEIKRKQIPIIEVKKKKAIPRVNPYLQRLLADYEKEILALSGESHTPGAAIAVVYDSTIVYLKGFGLKSSTDVTDSVDINTVFRIASVSKPFTSFLTGILVEDSILSWNDPVINYLPDFNLKSPEETEKLTIKHVLSHTTGLPYHTYTNMVEEGIVLDTMLSWLKDIRLATGVGEAYSYQNVAFSIVGEVIKSKTNKPFEDQMKEKVFVPLNMKTASIDYVSMMQNTNIARPHKLVRGRWKPTLVSDTYYNVAPAGGVNASISDMANWMIALLGNRPDVISKETLKQLYTPLVKAPSKNRNYGRMHRLSNSFYGLGWRVLYYPNDTLIYHGGYVNGYRSEVAFNPSQKIAVCILANAPGEMPDNGIPVFFRLFNTKRDSISQWQELETTIRKKSLLP
jgi:beta-lactamase class C